MCKISVIIPVYNVQDFLQQCLQSVVSQSLSDIEIICVDDCGNDNSMHIVEEMMNKDSRIKIVRHNINKGLPVSRNTGIDNANGEYIFFLDSDDYLTVDILEKLYNYAKENCSDMVVSKGKAFTESTDEKTLKRVNELNEYLSYEEKRNYKITKENLSDILENYPVVSWGTLFNREFITKNNLKFIDKKAIHEDNGFFIKTLSAFPNITFLDLTSVMYRIRYYSITSESNKNMKIKNTNMKIVLDDAIEYIKQTNKQTNETKQYSKILINTIKTSDTYCEYFGIRIRGFYTFIWGKNNKKIKILGIPVYREKIRKNKLIKSLLGIPIFIKKFNKNS